MTSMSCCVKESATLTAAIGNRSRADGVVPFRMERVTLNVERLHLGIADLDALFVSACVQRALDFQAGLGCRRRDQPDDSQAIRERPAAPGGLDIESCEAEGVSTQKFGNIVVHERPVERRVETDKN